MAETKIVWSLGRESKKCGVVYSDGISIALDQGFKDWVKLLMPW